MKLLGFLLFAFGAATIALHLLQQPVEWLAWIGTWGDDAAWGIRGGAALLGLILLLSGKKKSGGKK